MITHKNILIVKYGALGDVVRTSFFAKPLRTQRLLRSSSVRLYWLTAPSSVPLIRFHPYIDVITTNSNTLAGIEFDEVYSLDDETDVLTHVARLDARKIIGARLNSDQTKSYCDQSAGWFEMGLLSRHGKYRADELKRLNRRTHSAIFQDIFQVENVDFSFYNSHILNANVFSLMQQLSDGKVAIGLNAFAGNRWPAKALPDKEFPKLVQALSNLTINGQPVHLFLFGSGSDLRRNQDYVKSVAELKNITALDTDDNILDLAAVVRSLKLLITADSLCLHLAVGQQVPTVSFFAPTSAAEIENLVYVRKVKSLSDDYCNYRPDANNATITSNRILKAVVQLLDELSYA